MIGFPISQRPEVAAFLDEIETRDKLGTREIGFTGGEPFMNPQFLTMLEDTLERGFDVLILTNAMKPMQRKKVKKALLDLQAPVWQADDPSYLS